VNQKRQFFPISLHHLEPNEGYPFDLYAVIENRYVLIRPKGSSFSAEKILQFMEKKHNKLFIPLSQRNAWNGYLSQRILKSDTSSQEKAMAIKETAWNHVADLYTNENLRSVVQDCHGLVSTMIDFISSDETGLFNLLRLSAHDHYTYNHSLNVAIYAIALAQRIFPGDDEMIFKAGLGGLLHDIGKRNVDPKIINKPGKLTEKEWEIMKKHPAWGKSFLVDALGKPITPSSVSEKLEGTSETQPNTNSVPVSILDGLEELPPEVISVVYQHHESCDGSGYPENASKEEISALAKIGALADVYDALTTDRSYSKARRPQEAIELMVDKMAHRFDPEMFGLFKKAFSSKKAEEAFEETTTEKVLEEKLKKLAKAS